MKPYKDCMEVREDFSAYLDGEMATEPRAAIEAHLAICAECLRELDALKRVDDSYRTLDAVAAPAGFEASVQDAVRAGRMPAAANQRTAPRWMGPLVAMAAAAAVLIVGVLLLDQRQSEHGEMLLADTGVEFDKTRSTAVDAAAPAAAAANTSAWDSLTRAPVDKDSTWEKFAKAPAAPQTEPEGGGREDSGETLAQGLEETAEMKSEVVAGLADGQDGNAETRARAELIGTPPAEEAAPLAAATPEKIIDAPADESQAAEIAAPAPRAQVNAGEVLSRRTLRSFRVGADGTWYQSDYADQPRTRLVRESATLRELMKKHPDEDWSKMLGQEAARVFELDGRWYELEAAPQESN